MRMIIYIYPVKICYNDVHNVPFKAEVCAMFNAMCGTRCCITELYKQTLLVTAHVYTGFSIDLLYTAILQYCSKEDSLMHKTQYGELT